MLIETKQSLIKNIEEQIASSDCKKEWCQKCYDRFLELGIPTTKDEEWKYTSLAELQKESFEIYSGTPANVDVSEYLDSDDINVVYVDGILRPELSNYTENLPEGLWVNNFAETMKVDSIREATMKVGMLYPMESLTPFQLLNQACSEEGLVIASAKNTKIEKLIHVLHVVTEASYVSPLTMIYAEKLSEVSVLETHVSLNENTYLSNPLTDAYLEDGAIVHYTKAQKESPNAYHIGNTRAWVERNADFDSFSMMNGAKLTRNNVDAVIDGEGANVNVNALYANQDDQHVDNHTSVDHRHPNCTSNQLYKGLLNHSARAVFNGKIFVKPEAQQTNSYQLNQNLLIGDKARVDTKPQLEIFADDVRCTHGATIGQLEELELFYLQSRAISKEVAKNILATGFAKEALDEIKHENIVPKLEKLLESTFARI